MLLSNANFPLITIWWASFFDWNWGDQCVWGEKRITTEGQISTTFLEISEIQQKNLWMPKKPTTFSLNSLIYGAPALSHVFWWVLYAFGTPLYLVLIPLWAVHQWIYWHIFLIYGVHLNILRTYCDTRSVFFIILRAFVDMYIARFIMCCQNFVICGSFSYRLALRSLRLTACGP